MTEEEVNLISQKVTASLPSARDKMASSMACLLVAAEEAGKANLDEERFIGMAVEAWRVANE